MAIGLQNFTRTYFSQSRERTLKISLIFILWYLILLISVFKTFISEKYAKDQVLIKYRGQNSDKSYWQFLTQYRHVILDKYLFQWDRILLDMFTSLIFGMVSMSHFVMVWDIVYSYFHFIHLLFFGHLIDNIFIASQFKYIYNDGHISKKL